MRKLLLAIILTFVGSAAYGQGARFDGIAQRTIQNFLAPIPGATITVCTSAGTGTPCTPTASIFLDAGLTQPAPNPFTTDSNGNFGWYAAAGTTYKYSITATGVTGQLFTVVLPMVSGGAATFSTLTLSGLNGIQLVDGTTYPLTGAGLQAAINATPACSSGTGEVWVTKPLATITTQVTVNAHCATLLLKAGGQLTFNTGTNAGLLITGNTSTTHFNLKCDTPPGFNASAAVQLQATTMTGPLIQFGPTAGNDNNSNGSVVHGCNADGGGTAAYFIQSNGWNGMEISGNNTTNFAIDTVQLIHSFTTQVGPLNNFNGMVSGCDAAVSINDSSETKFVSNRVFTSFCDAFAMTTNPSDGVISTYNDLEQNASAWRIPLMTQSVKKFLSKSDTIENGNSFTLTAAANASGGNTTYTGTITSSSGIAGTPTNITGFVTGANNGTFAFVSSTPTTITVANAGGAAETHAGTAGFTPWSIGAIGSGQSPDISIEDLKMATNNQAVTFTNANPFRVVNSRLSPNITYQSSIISLIKENNVYGGTVTNSVTAANTIRDCDNDGHVPISACAFNKIVGPGGAGSVIYPSGTTLVTQDPGGAQFTQSGGFPKIQIGNGSCVQFGAGGIAVDSSICRNAAGLVGTSGTIFQFDTAARFSETTVPAGTAGSDICSGIATIHMLECSYNNASDGVTTFFPIPQTGNTSGTHSDSGFYQTAGASGCTTAASIGGVCATSITITWPVAFADANYKVSCTPIGPATNLPSTPYVVTPIAASVTINYFAITAAAASWPTVNCTAVHN